MDEKITPGYDLQKELGPGNRYDELAGRAQRTGYIFKDLHLVQLGTTLAEYIRNYEYNSDKFYLVIAKAKEVEKYINLLEKETLSIEDLVVSKKEGFYPSQLTLTRQNDRRILSFGTYKFRGGDMPINEEDIRKIQEMIHLSFPFFVESDEENTDIRGSGDGLGGYNTYTNYKNKNGVTLYEKLDRKHESDGEYGEIFSYFFPMDIPEEKLIQVFEKIKTYLIQRGLELHTNTASESKNNSAKERVFALSQGKSASEYYFGKEIEGSLKFDELPVLLGAIDYVFEKHYEYSDIKLDHYLDFYKQIIMKISQDFPEANLETIKENLQKRIRAKKYFLNIKNENDTNEDFREELNNFTLYLRELCDHDFFSSNYKYEIRFRNKVEDLKRQIKTRFENVEFIDFEGKGNPGFFIVFKPKSSNNKVIFQIEGYLLNPDTIEEQFYNLFQ